MPSMSDHLCEACPLPAGSACVLRERGQCGEAARERALLHRRPGADTPYLDRALHHAELAQAEQVDAEVIVASLPAKEHHGLGVNAIHTAAVLPSAVAVAAGSVAEVARRIGPRTRLVVLQAIWYRPGEMIPVALRLPHVTFLVRIHSNLSFLAVEPEQLRLLLEIARLAPTNVRIACVSGRLARWLRDGLDVTALHLPNLYDLPPAPAPRALEDDRPLRLGAFGALRLQKHHAVAAGAAAMVARRLGRPVELHINADRGDGSILSLLRTIAGAAPGLTLVEHGWRPHQEFAAMAGTMDLGLQPSASETFNYVTADLAARSVSSVVGEAIEWMPWSCRAPVDDPAAVAETALRLLADPSAGARARQALEDQQAAAKLAWNDAIRSAAPADAPRPIRRLDTGARTAVTKVRRAAQCVHRTPYDCQHITCALKGRVPRASCLDCPSYQARSSSVPA